MRVLVTGHRGFIGKCVYNELKRIGHDVDGLDRPDDIGDFTPYKIYGYYDCIIHLAAYAAIRDSIENPDKFWENNVVKSKPIFDYCRDFDVRCLYASSSAVKKWWENPYAITKYVNEVQAPPNSVGMRFYTVYADQDSRSDMMYRMLQEGRATYVTNHFRDWIHVNDVCNAIKTLMESEYCGVVDVGTGIPYPVKELARVMGQGDLPVKENTPGEADVTRADISVLQSLGWTPKHDVFDSARRFAMINE
jgi:UDP-glucose 4-epimerase